MLFNIHSLILFAPKQASAVFKRCMLIHFILESLIEGQNAPSLFFHFNSWSSIVKRVFSESALKVVDQMETRSDNADARRSSSNNSFYSFPPLPPIILPRSPRNQEEGNNSPLFDPPLQLALRNHGEIMPQSLKEQYILRISHFFNNPLGGFQINDAEFKSVITKKVCQLPSFFSAALFRKIDIESSGIVTRYWVDGNMPTMDTATQMYRILKQPDHEYLSQVDFKPILQELLETHPGLEFLKAKPNFQERYAETVIYRIFYHINRRGNGRLSLRELKRGNLIPAMQRVDDEEDTDGVLRYFSYKQFYVIFRKFGEVDANHDFLIDQRDLMTYGDGALTSRIVARIFEQAPRKFTCEVARHMNYEDFVYFLISVEDKSSEPSVEYWFKLLDLDGNGKLTPGEMRYFYEDHAEKPVSFEMILCQIIDMIAPEREEYITLRDLKRSDLSRIVFEVLSNREKLLAFDDRVRFPLPRRRGREHPDLIEWLRFVDKEFESMLIDAEFISSSEDEPMEDWGEPIEEMHD